MFKFAEIVQKYLALWVAIVVCLALFIGYHFPAVKGLKKIIPLLLFFMLFPMMITLRIEDIARALKDLKLSVMAIFLNLLIVPLLGALWAHVLFRDTDPFLAAGFILKVAVPCSGMVAAWTGYARGKVESALLIVALSLILSIFFVPFWMWILAGVYVKVQPMTMFKSIFWIVVLPLAAGLLTRRALVRKYGKMTFVHMAPIFPFVSTCGMFVMQFTIIAPQARLIVSHFSWVILIFLGIATLYPIIFISTILLSRWARTGYGDGIALGYSVTSRAHAITIGIATTTFGGTLAVLPAAVAPIMQIFIMTTILMFSERIKKFIEKE
ncbi:MAG: arsenic resistance protein [Deltaproteobacteria bacterium]|nr:arsenic resistance protein [Deltaproteobacteria bacterium]